MPDPQLPPVHPRAARYVGWIDRHRVAILVASLVVTVGSGLAASTLPVYSDFSYLLPPSTQSVQDLRKLEKRSRVLGTLMVAVKSDDPARRAAAAQRLRELIEAFPKEQVSSVTFDESVQRKYGWDNRYLFAPLADLQAARHALEREIEQKKLTENPLYVDFEEEDAGAAAKEAGKDDAAKLADLRKKLSEAEVQRDDPGPFVSKDGKVQMMVLRTPYSSGDAERAPKLLEDTERVLVQVRAEFPDVEMGKAGDVAVAKAEQDAILNGMLISTLLTVLLCVAAMAVYFRSLRSVLLLFWSLAVGTVAAFAFTRATIGHLNIATAFLSSIIIGNGINFGILLIARHLEERRAGRNGLDSLAQAVYGVLSGTLAAAMTASVAYGSLIITDFRGFRHFGIIGGVGMILCWASAFTVLPALLAVAERRGWIRPRSEPQIGRILGWMVPRRFGVVAVFGLLVALAAGFETWRFLSNDPYEANFKNLRSDSVVLKEERHWMHIIDEAFGQGISGGFAIALDHREDVKALLDKLRAADEGKGDRERLFSRVNSIDDLLPSDQAQKLAVLAQIRALLTDEVLDTMSDEDRADALRLRPPADLRALSENDIPELIAWPFTEADGSRGKMILAMSGWGYEIWNARDLVRFSDKVRALELPQGTLLGGAAFIFADMLALMERDGPLTTLAALIGA
ncbi:MAG: MMPL family transporter, partial [Deltaproteobacteria bacterium]|nr:MMPL family transporter [Deltaproteobacteria bacterium]